MVRQLGGVLKVDGVCCFHAAASTKYTIDRPQYPSSGVLPSSLSGHGQGGGGTDSSSLEGLGQPATETE